MKAVACGCSKTSGVAVLASVALNARLRRIPAIVVRIVRSWATHRWNSGAGRAVVSLWAAVAQQRVWWELSCGTTEEACAPVRIFGSAGAVETTTTETTRCGHSLRRAYSAGLTTLTRGGGVETNLRREGTFRAHGNDGTSVLRAVGASRANDRLRARFRTCEAVVTRGARSAGVVTEASRVVSSCTWNGDNGTLCARRTHVRQNWCDNGAEWAVVAERAGTAETERAVDCARIIGCALGVDASTRAVIALGAVAGDIACSPLAAVVSGCARHTR